MPRILFPVVGTVTYQDDFGEPRGALKHQGNDLLGDKRAPVVAVEAGKIEYWTTSASAGCMLYLYGASGTMYEYIHLNNDLTAANDNRGKCVQGVSYAVPDGSHVEAGQVIGYLGDSGDANGIHPHLHFEVHPNGGKAVDPFPFIKKAPHLLVAAPPAGAGFTLRLTGTVVELRRHRRLTLTVDTLTAWPSHLKLKKLNRPLTLAVAGPERGRRGARRPRRRLDAAGAGHDAGAHRRTGRDLARPPAGRSRPERAPAGSRRSRSSAHRA